MPRRIAPAVLPPLLLLLAVLTGPADAEITVSARLDRAQAQVGEAADLAVAVTGTQNAPVPGIASAEGVQVRYVGPSTQITFTNGRTNASVTHHFAVTATRAGAFTIGPITVDLEGRSYDAGSVTLTAVAAGAPPAAAANEPLRLVLSVPRTSVYLHERLPVSVALFVGAVRVTDVQYPTITGEGFAFEGFAEPSQHQERGPQGTVQVAEFPTILTPLRSGALTIGPAQMALSVVAPSRRRRDPFFDQFFGGDPFASQRPVTLTSEPVTLNVLPLPEEGKPADFSGAVGNFQFDVKAAPLDLQAGDPVTITFKIRGEGNLENVTTPQVAGSEPLRVYPVQQTSAPVSPGVPGHPGGAPGGARPTAMTEKTFEQVVIPQRAGAVSIPELRFSYFDPAAGAYRTIVHPPLALTVRAPAQAAEPPRLVGVVPSAPRSETLGRDIVFIKETPGTLQPRSGHRWQRLLFWTFQPLPLAAWVAVVLYDRHRRRLSGDAGYARFTRAGREARRALDRARAALRAGESQVFYDTVARAVSDYLSAKLDLPPGTVTAEAAVERLQARGLATPVADELHEFFAVCERVRFAPAADADRNMQRTFDHAAGIIRRLERERRLGRAAAAVIAAASAIAIAAVSQAADPQPAPTVAALERNPAAIFFHAGTLYGQERYQEAAAEYEKILAAGHASPAVYFNLGNAYFKLGDVGRAVLNYARARRLAPRDPDIAVNLSYARESREDASESPAYARLVFPLADRLNGKETLLATSAAYALLMLALIVARLVPRARRAARRAAVALGVALVILVTSGAFRLVAVELPRYAVVVAPDERAVRFEPSASGTEHFRIKPGSVLRVLSERDGWSQVARRDGTRGWLEDTALERM